MYHLIKAIIFDLGGVVVEINSQNTFDLFSHLSRKKTLDLGDFFKNRDLWFFQVGKMSEEEFLNRLAAYLDVDPRDVRAIRKAWDAMIVGIPFINIFVLKELRRKFPIYALSNTNPRHIEIVNQFLMMDHDVPNFKALFDKVYYSHEIGMVKPDKEIFIHVKNDNRLIPENTLVIDDSLENIEVAKALNFQTLHLTDQKKLVEELQKIGLIDMALKIPEGSHK